MLWVILVHHPCPHLFLCFWGRSMGANEPGVPVCGELGGGWGESQPCLRATCLMEGAGPGLARAESSWQSGSWEWVLIDGGEDSSSGAMAPQESAV